MKNHKLNKHTWGQKIPDYQHKKTTPEKNNQADLGTFDKLPALRKKTHR